MIKSHAGAKNMGCLHKTRRKVSVDFRAILFLCDLNGT